MAEHEVTETTTRKIYVYPCVKCGCDDIEIYNCGYSSFNCAGGKCKNAGIKSKRAQVGTPKIAS